VHPRFRPPPLDGPTGNNRPDSPPTYNVHSPTNRRKARTLRAAVGGFRVEAYRVWLGGDEVWPDLENEVAGKFDEIMRADEEQWQRLLEDKEQLDAELRLLKCQEVSLDCAYCMGIADAWIAAAGTPEKGGDEPEGRSGKVPQLDKDPRGKVQEDGGRERQVAGSAQNGR
jgi:hypothetical protein